MRPSSIGWPVRRLRGDALAPPEPDTLAAEEPLEIRVNGRAVVVTMRTPGARRADAHVGALADAAGSDEELAIGFLHDEGILARAAQVRTHVLANPLDPAQGNIVDVRVDPAAILRAPADRSYHASSACGVCGQASLDDMARAFARIGSTLRVGKELLISGADRMREEQRIFDATGGLHAAALFEGDKLVALREDIGRHNAVDKVVGWAYRERLLPLDRYHMMVSGRAGYEIVQKAAAAGIPVVAAVGAPSSLAARLAEQAGITLVGFVRGSSFNVYTHPERIA